MIILLNVVLSLLGIGNFLKNKTMKKFVYGKDDALFGHIEEQQDGKPFGNVLDAGSGSHSLRWIATLEGKGMTSFTAVTADKNMQLRIMDEAQNLGVLVEENHIVVGNWFGTSNDTTTNESFSSSSIDLPHDQYDTIIADYLIGAMDGFSPYRQEEMIPKLVALLKPGGNLYIIGLEPIPEKTDGPANIICKVRRTRDACIQLAGHRCYREYPVQWIQNQIEKIPDFVLKGTEKFPILYRYDTILRQIDVGRRKFPFFPKPELVDAMKVVLDELDEEARELTSTDTPIKYGFDYVVSAQKKLYPK